MKWATLGPSNVPAARRRSSTTLNSKRRLRPLADPRYPGDFTGWTETSRGKALVSEYAVLLSPDQSKSAVICVTDSRVVTIYDTASRRLLYSHPDFGRGLAVLSDLLGPVALAVLND